jgi:hypothetical protein
MTDFPHILAAKNDYGWVVQVLVVGVLLLMSALGSLLQKARERRERQAREREMERREMEPRRESALPPSPRATHVSPRQKQTVQEVVSAMRQAAAEQAAQARAAQERAAEQARQAQQKAQQRVERLARQAYPPSPPPVSRKPVASPAGQVMGLKASTVGHDVEEEIAHLRHRLQKAESDRDRRLSRQSSRVGLEATQQRHQGATESVNVHMDLAEARRAIVYREILGLPAALREDRPMWDAE